MKYGIPSCTPDKLSIESIIQIRNLAKSLKTPLSEHDVNLPHVSLLHVVSKAFGYENYNTAQALIGKPETKRQRKKNNTTLARTSKDEYFNRFMDAVRERMGDGMFEYVMKVYDYTNLDGNPMETLVDYGFATYDRLGEICAKEFEELNIEYFDVSKEGYEAFYKRFIFKEQMPFFEDGEKVVLTEGEEEAVLCVWPSKNEKLKQIIVALDRFKYLANRPQSKVVYRKNDNFQESLNQYTQSKIAWYKQLAEGRKLSPKRFNAKKIVLDAIPTEEEVENSIKKAINSVKRSLLLSGVATKEAGRLADWCVRFLGLENVNLGHIVSNLYPFKESNKFLNDASGTIANENAEMYIFAHFIALSPLPFPNDDWKAYIEKNSTRDHLKWLLKEYGGKRFVSKDLELIYRSSSKNAYGILYQFMCEEIDRIRFGVIDQALEMVFNNALKEREEECQAFLNEDEIGHIHAVLRMARKSAKEEGIEFEKMNYMSFKDKNTQTPIFNSNQILFLQYIKMETLLELLDSNTERCILSVQKSLPMLIDILNLKENAIKAG